MFVIPYISFLMWFPILYFPPMKLTISLVVHMNWLAVSLGFILDVGEAVLVLYTIILPLKYITCCSGSLVVATLSLSSMSTTPLVSMSVSLSGASSGCRYVWGRRWWGFVPHASPGFHPNLFWDNPCIICELSRCICCSWDQSGYAPVSGVTHGLPLCWDSLPCATLPSVSFVGSFGVLTSHRCCSRAWSASARSSVSPADLVGACTFPCPLDFLVGSGAVSIYYLGLSVWNGLVRILVGLAQVHLPEEPGQSLTRVAISI